MVKFLNNPICLYGLPGFLAFITGFGKALSPTTFLIFFPPGSVASLSPFQQLP